MTIHQEFLKFEAVLAHCETRAPNSSLTAAMDMGVKCSSSIELTGCRNLVSFWLR